MNKQLELMKSRTGLDFDLCGKCFVVCPYAVQISQPLAAARKTAARRSVNATKRKAAEAL